MDAMEHDAPLIEAHGLVKRYDGFALQGLDLAVNPGEVVGLVGSNGAGKTTTIKMLLGIMAPDAGSVRLLGQPLTEDAAQVDALKSQVGVVFDTCAFPKAMRVRDVAALGRAAFPAWDQPAWERLVGAFELPPRKTVGKLSRGMGMKLSLAFALAHHPRLLILDEATAGLDPLARQEVLELLRGFIAEEGCGILMSTHITSDLDRLADQVVCLDAGRVAFSLPKDAICDMADIARLGETELASVLDSGILDEAAPQNADWPLIEPRVVRQRYHTELLVPDRFAFAKAFPQIALERADIETSLLMVLEGEPPAALREGRAASTASSSLDQHAPDAPREARPSRKEPQR